MLSPDLAQKAQAEIGRLKAQLTTSSSTDREEREAVSNEAAISGSGVEIEAPDPIDPGASGEEANQ